MDKEGTKSCFQIIQGQLSFENGVSIQEQDYFIVATDSSIAIHNMAIENVIQSKDLMIFSLSNLNISNLVISDVSSTKDNT
jgi:hypothetical protein